METQGPGNSKRQIMDLPALLLLAIDAAIKGGQEIMAVYKTDFKVETKSDNTPVTLADKASSKIIIKLLSKSNLPVISEEEELPNYAIRKNWQHVWIIDPLDGTKEFIKKNGEFTVNVALIENNLPIIGVIYVPVFDRLYFAAKTIGSFLYEGGINVIDLSLDQIILRSKTLPLHRLPDTYTLMASRSHLSREINYRISQLEKVYGKIAVINAGSSIKQCWVAEGKAHEYSRLGITMEWDTAAGQCILEQSGNKLNTIDSDKPLRYNKEFPENPFFIAKNLN